MLKVIKKYLAFNTLAAVVLSLAFLLFPQDISFAQKKPYEPIYFTPQIEIPNSMISGKVPVGQPGLDGYVDSDLLAKYLQAVYNYGLGIGGVLATVMLMVSGIIWLTSAGDSGKIGSAKKLMTGSIVGMGLLYGAFLLLNTINPDLVEMKAVKVIVPLEPGFISCCHLQKGGVKTKITKKTQGTTEVITVSDGPFKGQAFPGCANILQGSTQCTENYECKAEQRSVSAGTSSAGGAVYTKITEYKCGDIASSPIPSIVIPNSTKSILCCGSKTGIYKTAVPNKFDVKEENGKFLYVTGSNAGKEFTGCGPGEYQCTGNQQCLTLKKSDGPFAARTNGCFDKDIDEVVCFCKAYKSSDQTICEISKTSKDCDALCNKKWKETGIIYSSVARPSEYFECAKDSKGNYDYFEIK